VVFHSVLAAEEGQFTLADVARGIHDKLYARHPHVFDPQPGVHDTTAYLTAEWERRKVEEKGRASVMDGIPAALPFGLNVRGTTARRVQRENLPAQGGMPPY
jgi:XTP/dITP diphosphohydrolase